MKTHGQVNTDDNLNTHQGYSAANNVFVKPELIDAVISKKVGKKEQKPTKLQCANALYLIGLQTKKNGDDRKILIVEFNIKERLDKPDTYDISYMLLIPASNYTDKEPKFMTQSRKITATKDRLNNLNMKTTLALDNTVDIPAELVNCANYKDLKDKSAYKRYVISPDSKTENHTRMHVVQDDTHSTQASEPPQIASNLNKHRNSVVLDEVKSPFSENNIDQGTFPIDLIEGFFSGDEPAVLNEDANNPFVQSDGKQETFSADLSKGYISGKEPASLSENLVSKDMIESLISSFNGKKNKLAGMAMANKDTNQLSSTKNEIGLKKEYINNLTGDIAQLELYLKSLPSPLEEPELKSPSSSLPNTPAPGSFEDTIKRLEKAATDTIAELRNNEKVSQQDYDSMKTKMYTILEEYEEIANPANALKKLEKKALQLSNSYHISKKTYADNTLIVVHDQLYETLKDQAKYWSTQRKRPFGVSVHYIDDENKLRTVKVPTGIGKMMLALHPELDPKLKKRKLMERFSSTKKTALTANPRLTFIEPKDPDIAWTQLMTCQTIATERLDKTPGKGGKPLASRVKNHSNPEQQANTDVLILLNEADINALHKPGKSIVTSTVNSLLGKFKVCYTTNKELVKVVPKTPNKGLFGGMFKNILKKGPR